MKRIIILLALCLPTALSAQHIIEMKNGTAYHGKVVQLNRFILRLVTDKDTLNIARENISRIVLQNKQAIVFDETVIQVKSSTTKHNLYLVANPIFSDRIVSGGLLYTGPLYGVYLGVSYDRMSGRGSNNVYGAGEISKSEWKNDVLLGEKFEDVGIELAGLLRLKNSFFMVLGVDFLSYKNYQIFHDRVPIGNAEARGDYFLRSPENDENDLSFFLGMAVQSKYLSLQVAYLPNFKQTMLGLGIAVSPWTYKK